ncbi:hypothetical protein ABFX02_04G083900 [Erythranthe guttata]
MSSTSFTSLLASDHHLSAAATTTTTSAAAAAVSRGLGDRIAERTGSGIPKFKSLPPPSLSRPPPSAVSPSSWFAIPPGLSPAELLDSPILLSSSNILPSPTTGSFPVHNSFNWNSKSQQQTDNFKYEEHNNSFSDFSFQTRTNPISSHDNMGNQKWGNYHESTKLESAVDSKPESNSVPSFSTGIASIQTNDDKNNVISNRKSEDGYNWRKYGQKQVKGSENPRSYYKCTYPNCPTKKKVERSNLDGAITEIVYKGSHNHPKPQSTRKSSSSTSANQSYNNNNNNNSHFINEIIQEHSYGSNSMGKIDSLENSNSISVDDDDLEQSSAKKSGHGEIEIDDEEPLQKRWKGEIETEGVVSAVGNRAIREPRVVVQTTSDIDILVDGYKWRKYGQKVVKGNPNPRSYYKCTSPSCPVRKHVERAAHDPRAVITTYEGKHNHDVPIARGSGTHRPIPNNIMPNNNNNNSNYSMLMSNLRPSQLVPYSLEMLQSANGSIGYNNSDFGNSTVSENGSYARAKDEPRDDLYLDSLLY